MSTSYMWFIRSLLVSLIITFVFGILITASTDIYYEYKDPEALSKFDLDSMSVDETELWFAENSIKKDGFDSIKLILSDWLVFRYWVYEQWILFLACFISCLVTHRMNTKYDS